MIKIKVQKVGILILISTFLQGCILTDEFKEALVEDNKKAQKTLIAKNEDTRQAKKLEQLESSVNELIEFKPQIVRVIKLEQDLAFLAESLKTMQGASRSSYLSSPSEGELQSSLAAVVDKKNDQEPLLADGNGLPPELQKIANTNLLAQPLVSTTAVELSSAPPLMDTRSVVSSTNIATNTAIDAKFSHLPQNNPSQNQKTRIIAAKAESGELADKLSSRPSAGNIEWDNDCQSASSLTGEFSIHLASYSNLENAKEGWEQLSKKHLTTLCGLKPVLASVNVAGKEYLSLRVGPVASTRDAGILCDAIRANGDYCAQARYEGRSL